MIKYIKGFLWRVAKCLSYREEVLCLKVNCNCNLEYKNVVLRETFGGKTKLTGGQRKLQRALGEWVLRCVKPLGGKWKLLTKYCLKIWRQCVVVEYRNNIRNYLEEFGSGISTGFVWLSMEGTTVTGRAMPSVRDAAIVTQKV